MTAAAVAGVLRPALAEVNLVSALAIAKERGIAIERSHQLRNERL